MSRAPLLTETSYDAGKSAELRQSIAMCPDDDDDDDDRADESTCMASLSLPKTRPLNLNKFKRRTTLSFMESRIGRREHDLSSVNSSPSRITTGHTYASTPRLRKPTATRSMNQSRMSKSRSSMWNAVRDGMDMAVVVPVKESSSQGSTDDCCVAVQRVGDSHFDPSLIDETTDVPVLATGLVKESRRELHLDGSGDGSNIVAREQDPRQGILEEPSLDNKSLQMQAFPTSLSGRASNDGHPSISPRSPDSIRALMLSRGGTVSRPQDDATRVSFEFSTISWGVDMEHGSQKLANTRVAHIMTRKDTSTTIKEEEPEEEDDSDEDDDDPFDQTLNPTFDDLSDEDSTELLHLSSDFDYLDVSFVEQVFGKHSRSTSPVTDSTSPITDSASPVTDISATDQSPKNSPVGLSHGRSVKHPKQVAANIDIGSTRKAVQSVDDGARFDFAAIDWMQLLQVQNDGNSPDRPIFLRPKAEASRESQETLKDYFIKPEKSQRSSRGSRCLNDHPAGPTKGKKTQATSMSRRYSTIPQLAPMASPGECKDTVGFRAVAERPTSRRESLRISRAANGSKDLTILATKRSKNMTSTPAPPPPRRKGKCISQRECGAIANAPPKLRPPSMNVVVCEAEDGSRLKSESLAAQNVEVAAIPKHSLVKKSISSTESVAQRRQGSELDRLSTSSPGASERKCKEVAHKPA